jgi:hypothetical protein
MPVDGRVAAAYVPTGKTQAKVNPGVTCFDTFFALVFMGGSYFDLIEVGAFFWHKLLLLWLMNGPPELIPGSFRMRAPQAAVSRFSANGQASSIHCASQRKPAPRAIRKISAAEYL